VGSVSKKVVKAKVVKKAVKKVANESDWVKLTDRGRRLIKSDPEHVAFILKYNLNENEYSSVRTWSFGAWKRIKQMDIGALKKIRKIDKEFYTSFYSTMSKLPNNKATLYRGLRLTPDDIKKLSKLKGKIFTLDQSVSYTSKFDIAETFAKGGVEGRGMKVAKDFVSTIWKIKAKTGKEIDVIGYTGLKENVMLKGSRIRVTGMTWNKVKSQWIVEGIEL